MRGKDPLAFHCTLGIQSDRALLQDVLQKRERSTQALGSGLVYHIQVSRAQRHPQREVSQSQVPKCGRLLYSEELGAPKSTQGAKSKALKDS